ncbi:RsbT co-antagonist protein RsbRA [Enhygromyxa salina]|uniref:RsbT co-antagonist protein RsbRA n=1 Tax=Enhygromyxa salina TaxID=215803 RepID=A0A2S9XKH4_9BACT|nr:STAS domain-containing protein [Enhygromyxa salina]PRP93386.1 RsbT co-antagonist protein RsbRA [Enhygromyxa salina]
MSADASNDFFEFCPSLLFVADERGTLLHWSKALTERFRSRLTHNPTLASLAAPDDSEAVTGFLRTLAESELPVSCRFRVPDEGEGHTQVRCEARRAPNGSIHGVIEVVPPADADDDADDDGDLLAARVERKLLRTIMDTLDIVLWAIDTTGKFIYHDGKAVTTAGVTPGQYLGKKVFDLYPLDLHAPIADALAGKPSHDTSKAHDICWETWFIPLANTAGETEYCVGLSLDVTNVVRTELELKRQLATIQDQQRAILELSAPLIEVWDKVLTVPLVGTIDNERANDLIERLLVEVGRANVRFAIVDLTGVDALDTATASHILRLLDSLRLLGVEGLITGISPRVAQTMAGLGIDLGVVTTRRTLRNGLRYCMEALRA